MNPAPKDTEERGDYQSYLLRLWRAGEDEEPSWRASLRSSRSGEQVGFESLQELFEYLRRKTGAAADDRVRSTV